MKKNDLKCCGNCCNFSGKPKPFCYYHDLCVSSDSLCQEWVFDKIKKKQRKSNGFNEFESQKNDK